MQLLATATIFLEYCSKIRIPFGGCYKFLTIVHNSFPLIPRKELNTVRTIWATAGKKEIKPEISNHQVL